MPHFQKLTPNLLVGSVERSLGSDRTGQDREQEEADESHGYLPGGANEPRAIVGTLGVGVFKNVKTERAMARVTGRRRSRP